MMSKLNEILAINQYLRDTKTSNKIKENDQSHRWLTYGIRRINVSMNIENWIVLSIKEYQFIDLAL